MLQCVASVGYTYLACQMVQCVASQMLQCVAS